MRVILVPIADRPECAAALSAAFRLATELAADVVGCHIRPHTASKVALPASLRASLVEGLDSDWARTAGSGAEKRSRGARTLFEQMANRHGVELARRPGSGKAPCALWQERVGSPGKVLAIVGPMSDLIVVSRPRTKTSKTARLFMLTALLHTARPVLILPPRVGESIGKRIVIAWNQSHEACRAVAASMPLLQRADSVTIFTAGTETSLGPKAGHLADYLKHWGVKTQRVRRKGINEAGMLKEVCRESRADLIVMGAYGRGRLQEWLFGGLTDHVLRQAAIPVLMHHQ